MRKLYLARSFNVMGLAAKIDVIMDEKTIAQLTVNDEETVDINEESHILQFVPSMGYGPKSEPVLIPRGDRSYRVTMSVKNGLLKNTIVTEIIEVEDSPEKSIASVSEDSQTDAPKEPVEPSAADKLFGFVAGKVKEAQTADLRHKQAMENLEERFGESELLRTVLITLKYNSGLYQSDKYNSSDSLSWAFTQQGIDDKRSRVFGVSQSSILLLWYDWGKESTIVHKITGFTFSKMGYAPLDAMEFESVKLKKHDVVLAFCRAFSKAFAKTFPDHKIASGPDSDLYTFHFGKEEDGFEVEYTVPEMNLKSII